jgi:nanoRNase/pAp phosphatase (c-di-AMP/oligoRNAs hydrolase)
MGVAICGITTVEHTLAAQPVQVLYHRDADGFASAFAAWCALGEVGVTYRSVQYGERMPAIHNGKTVYIVDFSYPREELIKLRERSKEVVVLDHHKTAAQELEGLDFCTFDMTKAGCQLAWEYFQKNVGPNAPAAELLAGDMPWALAAVADRDLWKFELPHTKEICARLDLEKWDFDVWHNIAYQLERGVNHTRFIEEGKICLRHQENAVNQQKRNWWQCRIGGTEVIVTNASLWSSETCQALLEQHPLSPFVATFRTDHDGIVFSLRSRGDFDVSAVAKLFGGGGHKAAAGFKLPHAKFDRSRIDAPEQKGAA